MSRIIRKRREEIMESVMNVALPLVAAHARRSENSDSATDSSSTPKTRPPNRSASKEVTPAMNPSPDNIECIDLTQTSVEDFFRPRKERRLGTVRKELEPSSAKKRPAKKKAGLKTTGLDNAAPEDIIIIDSDDDTVPIPYNDDGDDDDDCEIIEVDQANATARVPPASTTAQVAQAGSTARADQASPTVQEDRASTAIDSRPAKRAKVKNEHDMLKKQAASQNPENMEVEGVEVVEATAPVLEAATTVAEDTGVDDDVIVEGVVNETRLPHMRQHCTRFPFKFKMLGYSRKCSDVNEANSNTCDLCYCYVCDCPVKDCKNWMSSTSQKAEDNHCCASDKDYYWKQMRSQEKRKSDRGTTSESTIGGSVGVRTDRLHGTDDAPPSGWHFMCDCTNYEDYEDDYYACQSCWCYVCDKPGQRCTNRYDHMDAEPDSEYWRKERQNRKSSTYGLRGPFKPDHPDAHLNTDLTKCRHCSWFVSLEPHRSNPTSRDWCPLCGLVASEKDLEKQEAHYPDENENGETYILGEKQIQFRIQAHDPRLFPKFKSNWDDPANSGWDYDAAEQEEEVFLHRIGKSPQWTNLLKTIPHVAKDKVPNKPDNGVSDRYLSHSEFRRQDDTDAVIIEDPKQLQLVLTLATIIDYARSANELLKISAAWDKEARSGVFKIRLALPKKAFLGPSHGPSPLVHSRYILTLLGSWFGLFPLQPSDICGMLKSRTTEEIIDEVELKDHYGIDVPPYGVETSQVIDDIRDKLPVHLAKISDFLDENSRRLTLAPSSKFRASAAVYSSATSHSLRDSTARYFSEDIVDILGTYSRNSQLFGNLLFGQTRRRDKFCQLDLLLGYETASVVELCLVQKGFSRRSSSIKDIMIAIENLGHESEDCVEGLNIELLEFQRQSLRWALEREQAPGGVQSFFWSKLPITGESNGDLYYNPILNLFRKDKPALVRGGFIAEQMGLGKTVISLALILKNPAPEFPLSGSPVSELEKDDASSARAESCGWERNLYERTSAANKKTGSVISRGTLVICPVSLVGQWIDEARSKLKDPGLIYPYHGPNRKRDPNILAANSIVVTTYDILASDAFRKTKSAAVADYCPPLQQIRWWRIICDEGHLLREGNTRRSKSVLSLVADHKWIVTGTPMNTSPGDLINQLKFLGFEHVDKMFKEMGVSKNRRSNSHFNSELLMYLLRPIMMRHSQEQQYRGTSTTLMSLPPKTERKKSIKFSTAEKKAFNKIEKESQDWYLRFRSANRSDISRHFLKLSSKLKPLQMACSGGKCPKLNLEDGLNEGTATMNTVAGLDSNFVFESKFKTLIKKLKKIRDTEPESKSLVFSQFSSTLDWLKSELPKNGFQFRTLSGDMTMKKRAKALSEFQNDPPTTIFLLSMRAGAVGINLTQANRVFLMEPSFNPALEAQAIGRIHRLGQKRPVEIVRLIMKDSFEERMVNFLEQKYGKDSSTKNEADDKQAGNLKADKVELVTEEFDILFGVKDRLAAIVSNEIRGDNDAVEGTKADGAISMSNL
eukprot:CAMPEP_0116122050 /NCGR_PEP_ID=MMETSP0329-20121206/4012_1 /TAXON_ID=697910 /ORGANISM="Pseudo-nitzschia arenysensis, Strain B593" /LENGTH=1515 /DNA_ID=CAMNT_0003615881 /DNA_START=43 /DNA_END=4590 /DNA_ORIENTATION=+